MLRIPITPLLIILFNDLLIRLHVRDALTFSIRYLAFWKLR